MTGRPRDISNVESHAPLHRRLRWPTVNPPAAVLHRLLRRHGALAGSALIGLAVGLGIVVLAEVSR